MLVQLSIQPQHLSAVIQDNGNGFDVKAVFQNPDKWDHFGLRGMKERAKLLNGEVSWESRKDEGTTVTVSIPLTRKDSARNGKKN